MCGVFLYLAFLPFILIGQLVDRKWSARKRGGGFRKGCLKHNGAKYVGALPKRLSAPTPFCVTRPGQAMLFRGIFLHFVFWGQLLNVCRIFTELWSSGLHKRCTIVIAAIAFYIGKNKQQKHLEWTVWGFFMFRIITLNAFVEKLHSPIAMFLRR